MHDHTSAVVVDRLGPVEGIIRGPGGAFQQSATEIDPKTSLNMGALLADRYRPLNLTTVHNP